MDRIDFERRLGDYVRGEVPDAVAREIDDYMAAHSEAVDDVEAVRGGETTIEEADQAL